MKHRNEKNLNRSRRSSTRGLNSKDTNYSNKSQWDSEYKSRDNKYQRTRKGISLSSSIDSKYDNNEIKRRGSYQSMNQSKNDNLRNNFSNKARNKNSNSQYNRIRNNTSKIDSYNENIATSNSSYEKTSDSSESYFSSNNQLNSKDIKPDLIWGRHASQAALETGRPIHRIWCTPELRSSSKFFQLLRDSKTSGVLLEEVSWARLGQITNGNVHQGIALQTAAVQTLDLKKLIQACSSLNESPLLLALDGLTDPHNVGSIVRSAEAFGAHGLVLPQRRSAGLTGSVAKVAAGALEHLPVARVVNLNRSLLELKKGGYSVIGLAEEGTITLQEADFNGPLVLVIGSEDKGLSVLTRKNCDQLVRIPLRGLTPSLNASIATSIVLYEIARNGWMKSLLGQAPSPKLDKAKFSSL